MSPMEYLCQKFDKIKGHISENLHCFDEKLEYMARWEADLQESIELEEWHTIAQGASKSIINTSMIEANYYNVILRWYMVPARLATFIPGASPLSFLWMQTGGNDAPCVVAVP